MTAHGRGQSSVQLARGPQPSRRPVVVGSNDIVDMVRFALRWLPFGGGSDMDIFVEFGTPASEFYRRLAVILRRRPELVLNDVDRCQLLRLCSLRSTR